MRDGVVDEEPVLLVLAGVREVQAQGLDLRAGSREPGRRGDPDAVAAEGTDTYELNRNLVLTDGARADSVPNLEIETGEIVGAGHASATGRFDDEQLFYLQARGIPEVEARRLVVRGFFVELVQRIGVPEVEQRLMSAIEAELAASVGAPPSSVDPRAEAEVTA